MQNDPNKTADIKYSGGQSPSEDRDQTENMPKSRIRMGAVVTAIAFGVVIVIGAIVLV